MDKYCKCGASLIDGNHTPTDIKNHVYICHKCKATKRRERRKLKSTNPEFKEKEKTYRLKNKLRIKQNGVNYRHNNASAIKNKITSPKHRTWENRHRLKLKLAVYLYYSDYSLKCKNCDCDDILCLSLDHINGGGIKQRKDLGGSGPALYKWIIRNNFPSEFQILCMNCQWRKRYLNGEVKNSTVNLITPSFVDEAKAFLASKTVNFMSLGHNLVVADDIYAR